VGLTTLPPSCADCLEIWEPQPPGTPQGLSRPVMGLLAKICFSPNAIPATCLSRSVKGVLLKLIIIIIIIIIT
jgi:hypothetical protein